tara:strand:+ start:1137 stop:1649 length:513 start_codon:yes stop_codon:yes gene_type:complete
MSFEITLILTPSFVKSNTIIHSNVDDNLIVPLIRDCQNLFVEPILGSGLFDEIITEVKAGSISALNTTLIDEYLIDVICNWVLARYIRQGSHKVTNKGTVNMSGDNATISSKSELIETAQVYLDNAEEYAQRTTLYLMENETDYPLYQTPPDGCDIIKPRRDNYETGFIL